MLFSKRFKTDWQTSFQVDFILLDQLRNVVRSSKAAKVLCIIISELKAAEGSAKVAYKLMKIASVPVICPPFDSLTLIVYSRVSSLFCLPSRPLLIHFWILSESSFVFLSFSAATNSLRSSVLSSDCELDMSDSESISALQNI